MSFQLFLFVYVFGGLTFIPLVISAAIALFWYTAPVVDEEVKLIAAEEETKKEHVSRASDGAASGTFAVLRQYDFAGAQAAFKEASNASNQTDANGEPVENREGVSVYQSMYRSVFDRNRQAANPLQEAEQVQQPKGRIKARGKVFYIVLRHGHLMLYDSQTQLEVRHVISLAHYTITLRDDISIDSSDLIEAELFAKRTAIVLTALPSKQNDGVTQPGRKPFFLYSNINIEKEDFYHALLSSINDPPIPRPLDPECTIKLQSALHSNSLTPETRALNALLGRVFLALHRTPFLETFIKRKIEKKIARIQKPAFIASIAVKDLSLGDAAPIITNPKLQSINISGETVLSLDMKYLGGINITIAAVAKLDLGQRFKTRMVTLLLAVVLQRIQGKMLVKIKPSPSNRIWFCFESMPEMELKIEPVVSSRQITYAFVLRAIETRIREAFAEGMVKPNWDDTPFFATESQYWRGGLWESEGREAELAAESNANGLAQRNAKTMSTPALGSTLSDDASINSAATSGIATLSSEADSANLKKRPTSLNAQSAADRAWGQTSPGPRPPKSIRSPSLASFKPVVAVDDFSADAVKSDDAIAATTRRRWIGRGGQQQTQRRDAAEAVRQVRDRDEIGRQQDTTDTSDLLDPEDAENMLSTTPDDISDLEGRRQASEPEGGEQRTPERTMTGFGSASTLPRISGRRQPSTSSISHSRNASRDDGQPQRKTILATTAAATAAAKNWTWNAMQNRANRQQMWNRNGVQRQGSHASDESSISDAQPQGKVSISNEPMGRGQPLPPPGMPLPGPAQKTIWGAAAAGLGNMRRKPVPALPPRRGGKDTDEASLKQGKDEQEGMEQDEPEVEAEGEFGPWMANDADSFSERLQTGDLDPLGVASELPPTPKKKKQPPPLPRRREDREEEHKHESLAAPQSTEASTDPLTLQTVAHEEEHDHDHDQGMQSPTPPDLIDFDDHTGAGADGHLLLADDSHHPDQDNTELDDDVQAIAAPVDPEAEETGILDMADHLEPAEEIATAATKTAEAHDILDETETSKAVPGSDVVKQIDEK